MPRAINHPSSSRPPARLWHRMSHSTHMLGTPQLGHVRETEADGMPRRNPCRQRNWSTKHVLVEITRDWQSAFISRNQTRNQTPRLRYQTLLAVIREIADEVWHQELAADYVAAVQEKKSALVIAPTHAEGRAVSTRPGTSTCTNRGNSNLPAATGCGSPKTALPPTATAACSTAACIHDDGSQGGRATF